MIKYWDELRREFKKVNDNLVAWKTHEYDLFFEIETLLYLYEYLVPDMSSRSAEQTWALVSGYYVPEVITNGPQAKKILLNTRQNIRYIKAATAWHYWLQWYKDQPTILCLYQFGENEIFEQRSGVILRGERLQTYDRFFSTTISAPSKSMRSIAVTDNYTFDIDKDRYTVTIPESLVNYSEQTPFSTIQPRETKTAIELDLTILMQSAIEIDEKESQLELEPSHFQDRLHALCFLISDDDTVKETTHLQIDGLFHLVGALGVGKSTIIKLLVYHLATVENRHVSIIMNTIVEAFQIARWFRLLGVTATPALGKNRAEHIRRVSLANPEIFSPETLFYSADVDEPLYRWMPKPCALSALANQTIPVGKEPCWSLVNAEGNKHRCPLISTCPVHQMSHDLVDSQVWVLNPASFIYSRAPEELGENPLYLMEAVYHQSDLLIIDEADRVQANWDNTFAPSSAVLGTDDAFLDWLHQKLGTLTSGTKRNNMARTAIIRLTNMDDQCNMLANRAYNLFAYGKKRQLIKWVENRQLTNESIFRGLLKQLKNKLPRNMNQDEKDQRFENLYYVCKEYWKNPLSRQSDFLAEWLSEFLGSDIQRKNHDRKLDDWLIETMGWNDKKPQGYRLLCRKLDLAVTLTALIKRINDISYQMRWAEDELQENIPLANAPIPDVLLDILPEPPLGRILGLRIVTSPKTDNRTFHALRYHGVGRWLLLNLHHLFKDTTGKIGPHVLLTSATSWLPNSANFHIAKSPQAILINTAVEKVPSVDIRFSPVEINGKRLRVSGAKYKEDNLKRIVQALAKGTDNSPSDLERELTYWQKQGKSRCILLVVNSYEQVKWVMDELQTINKWQGRVLQLFPDDSELTEFGIRTREVERFYKHNADILIAPLMAIQRGFNILDELGDALLGTAFFLVRPFPPPHDLNPQIMSLNTWYLKQLDAHGRTLVSDHGDTLQSIQHMRLKAQQQWIRRLKTKGSLRTLDDDLYQEFLRDSFVTIWQTIGRMIRGGNPAKAIFVDEAFADTKGNRHILHDWHEMLETLKDSDLVFETHLAHHLYQTAWEAFDKALKTRRI